MKKKNPIHAVVGSLIFCSVLTGCNDSKTSEVVAELERPTANQKVGKVKVCQIINNHAFNGGFSVLDADIKIEGGSSNDWAVTGIAVAKQLGSLGLSTDVKLTVYRSDLGELDTKKTANGYKWLTRIDYGIDPKRSLNTSNGDKQWLISYATDSSVATPGKIKIDHDYHAINDKFGNPAIDDKVVAAVKKKYNLSGEFHLHRGNLNKNTNDPNEFFIDSSEQNEKLSDLKKFKELGENRSVSNLECST